MDQGGLSSDSSLSRAARKLYVFLRVSTLGFSLLLPVVGALHTDRALPFSRGLLLLAIALSFHVFAYVLNDVMDLWLDRTEPLRADSLLVRSEIDRRYALFVAWLQMPVAFVLAWSGSASGAALVALGVAFIALAAYDAFGKRCPWPVLTDAAQGLGWCALTLVGAWFDGMTFRETTVWLLAFVFVYVVQVNGIHGGLRDIANDFAQGARTTAIWLGARPAAGGQVRMPRALGIYGSLLQLGLVGSTLLVVAARPDGQSAVPAPALPLLAVAVSSALFVLSFAVRKNRRRFIALGAWHMVATMSVLPCLYVAGVSAASAVTLLAVFCLPGAAMFVYNGSHWHV